jgi:hypothetical protein
MLCWCLTKCRCEAGRPAGEKGTVEAGRAAWEGGWFKREGVERDGRRGEDQRGREARFCLEVS